MPVSRISLDRLNALASGRLLILDGGMGTLIQRHSLTEADYRGTRFAAHASDLSGNHDLVTLTQPQIIASLHRRFLDAGADIIETNTFNANAISQAAYQLEPLTYELNFEAARLACGVADEVTAEWPSKPRIVAGAMGPSSRTVSSGAITFDEMKAAYLDQVRGLVDGGVDVLLLETIIDAPSAQAAIAAIQEVQHENGVVLPLMISLTIVGRGGRILSGETVEECYRLMEHAQPWSIGINCAPGARDMRPLLAELSAIATCWTSAYPNAGLPNADGDYGQQPLEIAALLRDVAESGFANILGGCCGTAPEHIKAIADAVKDLRPRLRPSRDAGPTREPGLLTIAEARANYLRTDWDSLHVPAPWFVGKRIVSDQRLEELVPFIDWSSRALFENAHELLERIVSDRRLQARAVYGFWPANSDGDDIVVYKDDARRDELTRFRMLRQQEPIADRGPNRSLADFIAPAGSAVPDYIGLFALTAGIGVDALVADLETRDDQRGAAIAKAFAGLLARAFAEFLRKQVDEELGYSVKEILSPGHGERPVLFDLLGAPQIGISLEGESITPAESIAGFYFSHPQAASVDLGRIGRDQIEDYARRKSL